MKRIIPAFLLLLLTTVYSAKAGEEPKGGKASNEAVVIRTHHGCGYMLQFNNGQRIEPVNFPKKFMKPNEHVLVVLDGTDKINGSPCDIVREGYIVEISFVNPDPGQHVKLAGK